MAYGETVQGGIITGENMDQILLDVTAHTLENGKWEHFTALYLRDREASDRTPWAGRLGDALYNCLTKTLFVQKDSAAALELAHLLRAERDLFKKRQ